MSRQARIRSLTEVYHVMQRGLNRMNLFNEEDDRNMFLNLLKFQASDSFKIYCYCLMDNHIHFLVKTDQLSPNFQRIASVYAMWFNQKYQRSGYLFQDRFKSEAIETENYFLTCFRYILQNPVKAGMCNQASSYRWSSCQACFNPEDSFIDTTFIPFFFDTKEDFEAYLSIIPEESIPDIEQPKRLTDDEIKKLLNQKLNDNSLDKLSLNEQKLFLKEIKNSTHCGLRQLARITNIGYSIIRRL